MDQAAFKGDLKLTAHSRDSNNHSWYSDIHRFATSTSELLSLQTLFKRQFLPVQTP
jgi:hypothetical protein